MRFLRLSSLCAAVLASSFAYAFELSLDTSGKAVVLKAAQPSEVVRYTLNGKDPDFSAGVYLAPIELPEGGTVKAAAFEGNKRVGEVRTQVV
ncbi:MAG: FN3 associated domain-containing protein, partial [Opitutales bacterium]